MARCAALHNERLQKNTLIGGADLIPACLRNKLWLLWPCVTTRLWRQRVSSPQLWIILLKLFFIVVVVIFLLFSKFSVDDVHRERDLDPLIVYACTLAAFHGRTKEHENMNHARSAKHDTLHSVDAALSGLMLRNTCFGFFFYLWACLLCVSICERMFLCRTCLRAFMKAFTSQAQSLWS